MYIYIYRTLLSTWPSLLAACCCLLVLAAHVLLHGQASLDGLSRARGWPRPAPGARRIYLAPSRTIS